MSTDQTGGPPVLVQPAANAAPSLTPAEMISPEQHIAGVAKFYQIFRRTEVAYRMVNEAVHGKRKMPILSAPLGTKDDAGNPEILELDLHAPFDKIVDPGDQLKQLAGVLGPLNNYYAAAYATDMRTLALYSLNGWKLLSGEQSLNTITASFDDLIAMIHSAYAEFEPRWKVVKQVEDGLAMGETTAVLGGVIGIDLGALLEATRATPEQQQQALTQVLGGKVAELRKELVPCLQNIAIASGTAVTMIDKSNQTSQTPTAQ